MAKKRKRVKLNNPPCYMGLDVSMSGTGVSIFDTNAKHIHSEVIITKWSKDINPYYDTCTPHFKRARDFYRYKQVIDRIRQLCASYRVCAVVIENYAFGVRKSSALTKLGELGGILRLDLILSGVRWIEISSTSNKKFISGSGSCAHSDVPLKVFQKWKEDFEYIISSRRLDAAISYGLGMICYRYFCPSKATEKIYAYEMEVMKTINKNLEKEKKEALGGKDIKD